MSDLHKDDKSQATPMVAIDIVGSLADHNDGELALALTQLLEKIGFPIANDSWHCWEDLSRLPTKDRVAFKWEALQTLFTAIQATSNGTLRTTISPQAGSLHLEGTVILLGTVVLLRAVWQTDHIAPEVTRLIDHLPVLALRHKPSTQHAQSTSLTIETNWVWDNVMVGMSFEDAATYLHYDFQSIKDQPHRQKGSLETVYTAYGTVPGCAAHLFATSDTPQEAGKMLCETTIKTIDILMRRLDIARASVFEGQEKTAFLLDTETLP